MRLYIVYSTEGKMISVSQEIAEVEQEIEAMSSAIHGAEFIYGEPTHRFYKDAFVLDSIHNYKIKLRNLKIQLANLEAKHE